MNPLPREWLSSVEQLLEHEPAVVRIVVAEVRGSAPRDPGAFMLVAPSTVEGTIGGGRLEWDSIAAARELLTAVNGAPARLSQMVLGQDLGQCCGGVVSVWLERLTRDDLSILRRARDAGTAVLSSTLRGGCVERRVVTDPEAEALLRKPRASARPRVLRGAAGEVTFLERLDEEFPALWLYGAGHVGQSLARMLMELPLRLTWIDSRAELLPASVPDGMRVACAPDPATTVAAAPPGAYFLVMTHSHPLDYALCQEVLKRGDFAWLGLIGSASKSARFRSRLAREGVTQERIARLVCPIGIEGIESKWPAAIAVGVAAQIMQQMSGTARPVAVEHRVQHACAGEECSTCGTRGGAAARDGVAPSDADRTPTAAAS